MVTRGSTVWLGSRLEYLVTDFDGRVRQCRTLGQVSSADGADLLVVDADPPLPGQERGGAAVLRRRRPSVTWDAMQHGWIEVLVGVVGAVTAERVLGSAAEPLAADEITSAGQGEAAARQELLPPTQEQLWDTSFAALERFVAREGHARVPQDHREGDLGLGNWVANQRFKRQHGYLPEGQAARLDALPGWEW